jgi:hypothetical protein
MILDIDIPSAGILAQKEQACQIGVYRTVHTVGAGFQPALRHCGLHRNAAHIHAVFIR